MTTAHQWLDWLAAGNVPAALCRLAGTRVVIDSRTSAFDAAVDGHPDWPGEEVLLAELASAWPDGGDTPSVLHFDHTPDWNCVLQALDDPPTRCVAILRRTTERERHNEAFFTTVQTLPDIVARMDLHHRHLYINPAIERVTGLAAQSFIGKSKREIGLPPELVAQWEALVDRVLDSRQPAEEEHELPTRHGPRHYLTRVVPERSADGVIQTVVSTSHDITGLKSLQRQLALLASTDPLTSLLNRRGFLERLESELSRMRSNDGQLGLLLLDVDNFKAINDTYGHMAGDNVLMAIGDVLHREVGDRDFVARLGGDEFCVGLVDADREAAGAAAERIRLRIADLDAGHRCPCAVSVSIGLTAAAGAGHTVSDLIASVDQSMYRAKSGRRDPR
ncbi:GGDEF domain-containing protein [Mycobacterium sp. shizuoka-1]|uniref:GGDEF domain-containing protein n=1 Tax=Mycobacterium sp. shizuoka-1 TaxID=2039281 RepID=UPI000C066849|nr:GGDEF domain-containing protein [Mycobacterium sp. shizuoka-1]GAY18883.1 hypothetical protein MSZK_56090 [Mycobacterium sp. shizuoka-1]